MFLLNIKKDKVLVLKHMYSNIRSYDDFSIDYENAALLPSVDNVKVELVTCDPGK